MTYEPKPSIPPRGVGISRRLIFTMIGIMGMVAILFLTFLHQTTHRVALQAPKYEPIIDNETSDATIQRLEQEKKEPHPTLLVPTVDTAKVPSKISDTLVTELKDSNPISDNDFKQGGDAEISVYQSNTAVMPPAATSSSLSADAIGAEGQTPNAVVDNYSNQNMQSEKAAFLRSSTTNPKDTIQSQEQKPISPYEVKAGTLIAATLMTGINSDLPGTIIAKVSRDIFDTATGNYLLIPQGTTLLGAYDSQVAYGQSRVLIAWSRLIFPNGNSFDLEGQPGVDLVGMAGLHDLVNNHYYRIFGSALLFSAFGAAGQLSQPQTAADQMTTQQIIYGAIGQQMTQTGAQLVQKNMNIQPTLQIRPGTNFNVLLTRDMILSAPYRF